MTEGAAAVLDALLRSAEARDYAGWDPMDVWERRPLRSLLPVPRNLPHRLARAAAVRAAERAPRALRRLARTPRRRLPYAVSLFAEAYALRGDNERADELLAWLLENRTQQVTRCNLGSWGWELGYEHPGTIRLGRGIPAVTVTYRVFCAFAARGRGDVLEEIGRDLERWALLDGPCFPYTPEATLHVHNANLAAAEMLARTGRDELARDLAAYWLADGATFEYLGPEGRTRSFVDHLHAASVVRSAVALRLEGRVREKYVAMFESGYPVAPTDRGWSDAHSFAEAIRALLDLGERDRAETVLQTALDRLWLRDRFAYRVRRADGRVDPMEYLRWNDAPMAAALAALGSPTTGEGA